MVKKDLEMSKEKVHDKNLIKDAEDDDCRNKSLAGVARNETQTSDGGFSIEKNPSTSLRWLN